MHLLHKIFKTFRVSIKEKDMSFVWDFYIILDQKHLDYLEEG